MKRIIISSFLVLTIILLGNAAVFSQSQDQVQSDRSNGSIKKVEPAASNLSTQIIQGDSLKIAVWDNLRMQVWKWQDDRWVNQVYGEWNKGYKLFYNENNMASYYYGNEPTPVSNSMVDDYTIVTVVRQDNVELRQTVSYTNGNNYYSIRWDIVNKGETVIDSLKFFAGEDTYFAGNDYGRGYWDNNRRMVYVKNEQGGETGIMGFYGTSSSPATTYMEDNYSTVRSAVVAGYLTNSVNPDNVDAGYALGWRYSNLEPNMTWTISAMETFQTVTTDNEAPSVTLIYPNGGEWLQAGNEIQINWSATDNIGVTKIDLWISSDGGETFKLIASDLENSPPYNWLIPDSVVSGACKVKVIAYDAAFNFSEDMSDGTFEINPASNPTTMISTEYGPPAEANVWEHYQIPLTAEIFGVDQATFEKVLSNVTLFRIRTEMHTGDDVGGLDEVKVGRAFYSGFNDGTDGWSAAGDGTMEWMSGGGVTGGYLQISDWASGDWHWAVAPVNWSGDWRGLIDTNIDFYFKTNYPSYSAVIEIYSEAVNRLVLTATPQTIKVKGTSTVKVALNATAPKDVLVTLTSSNPGCIDVPENITIPAGSSSATFIATSVGSAGECSSVITASAEGYGNSRITLNVSDAPSDTSILTGRVTDATTGNGIAGATVTIAGISTTTDENGNYRIINVPTSGIAANFSATPRSGMAPLKVQFTDLSGEGYQQLTAWAEGYTSYETSIILTAGETKNFDISLSPTLAEGELRLVLNWGSSPYDLDIHLKTPEINGSTYEVYFNDEGSATSAPFVKLDHDDIDGFGPETITIYKLFNGTYKCYVYNYSGSPDITTSGALVKIYTESGLAETIHVPTSGSGLFWYVCDIDGATGAITVINTLQSETPTIAGFKGTTFNEKKKNTVQAEGLTGGLNIESWQWDFNNDGTVDATIQNPTFTYTHPGSYTVKLTVSDGTNSYSETKTDYITVLAENVAPTVSLLSPNGGESYKAGSNLEISWSATDNVGVTRIDLLYSIDGGETFQTIVTNLANTPSKYLWEIPTSAVSESCKIKVIAYDAVGNFASDVSDAVFSVQLPYKTDYRVTISSIDVTTFPQVKCFVSVVDTASRKSVAGLVKSNFSIKENEALASLVSVQEITSSSGAKADIVFVMDVTGSLSEEIAGLKNRALRFADSLAARGIDYRLGLVTFRDEIDEVHDFTSDAAEFKSWIDGLYASGGGDVKENALEGLARAASLSFRATTQKIAILITDAEYHQAGEAGDGTTTYTTESMIDLLNEKGIVTNVVGPDESQFHQLAEQTGGMFYNIDNDFQTIIDEITQVIFSQYVVTFTSPNPVADNTVRKVGMSVENEAKGGYGTGTYLIGSSRLVMTPTNIIGIVNNTFNVDIRVESILNLGLCHFIIQFDPSKVELTDHSAGDFLGQGGASANYVPEVDNSKGTIEVSATRLNTVDGANGSGLIYSLKFKVLVENCTSDITFTTVDLRQPDNSAIATTSQGAHIQAATVVGLLGDFDKDLDIDTRDLALLSTYWKPVNNASGDIGPATGTPPTMTPVPDGVVNFEDLFVFARMWNWFHSIRTTSGGGSLAKAGATIEWRISEQQTDADIVRLQLWANDIRQLAMGHLVIHYDSDGLQYKSAGAGKLLRQDQVSIAFWADVDPQKGVLDIALSRLASGSQDAEVSGAGELLTIEFMRKDGAQSPTVSLETADLRSADNSSLAVGEVPLFAVDGTTAAPGFYRLEQNYPNPFNIRTQISFQLPVASQVRIQILNILGQPVRTLVNSRYAAGSHKIVWDGRTDSGKDAISGIYFVRMQAGSFRQTREMLLIK